MATTAEGEGIADAKRLVRESVVCDLTLPFQPEVADFEAQIDPRKSWGYDFVSLTVNPLDGQPASALEHVCRTRVAIKKRADLILCDTMEGIRQAHRTGRLALGFHFQETEPYDGSEELVEIFAHLGVRSALLAYNCRNRSSDGCAEDTDAGLSRVGRRIVAAMNRHGVIVDGTHSGCRSTLDAMELSTAPVIFSHSNCRAIFDHYRNITDDQIRMCAKTDGVIGVNGVAAFLNDPDASARSIFRHLDHIVQMVGAEHAAVGLDSVAPKKLEFLANWITANPDLWPDNAGEPQNYTYIAQPAVLVELVAQMVCAGYEESAIKGILGGNFLRVAGQVWRTGRFD